MDNYLPNFGFNFCTERRILYYIKDGMRQDLDNFYVDQFERKEDAMNVYSNLKRLEDHHLPEVLAPFQVKDDPFYYLIVEKQGVSLDTLAKKKNLFESTTSERPVIVLASQFYGYVIRGVFKTIQILKDTPVRAILSQKNIFIQHRGHMGVKLIKFRPRGDKGYDQDCKDLRDLLERINNRCRISTGLKHEFDDFFSCLSNCSLRNHNSFVLNHTVFWDWQLRIHFVFTLHDFLLARGSVGIYNQETRDCFDQGIKKFGTFECDENLRLLYGIHLAYVRYNGKRCLLQKHDKKYPLSNEEEIMVCLEVLRNIFEHFESLRFKDHNIKVQSSKELQHVVQLSFPKYIYKLAPIALRLGLQIDVEQYLNASYI